MMEHTRELIIVGGGPAGLAAGIYAARDELDCLLFEKGSPGGQILVASHVANYPGFPDPLSGIDLAEKMREHALRFGLRIIEEEVSSLSREEGVIRLGAGSGSYAARTVIIATGAAYQKLGVPGEDRLRGRGVSYCGTCDGPLFHGRPVVVVGGGDTAVEEALFLARFASEVRLIHRRDSLRAKRHLQKQALAHGKIRFIWDSVVREILGEDRVRGVVVENVRTGSRADCPCEAVFISIGTSPRTEFLKGMIDLDEGGHLITDINMHTSVPGVFGAGDVRRYSVRQVASAVGDGVTALLEAECYLAGSA